MDRQHRMGKEEKPTTTAYSCQDLGPGTQHTEPTARHRRVRQSAAELDLNPALELLHRGWAGSLAQRFRLKEVFFRNPWLGKEAGSPWHWPRLQGDLYKVPRVPQGNAEKAATCGGGRVTWPCCSSQAVHVHRHSGLPTPSLLAHHHESS